MKSLARVLIPSFLLFGVIGSNALAKSIRDRQEPAELELTTPAHVRGQVVGEDGKPIAKVRLYHSKQSQDVVTDSNGQFDLVTSAPSFVAQRPGFQSVLVHTRNPSEFYIVLRKASRPDYPVCSNADLSNRAPGWGGVFQIPLSRALKTSPEVLDVDYWSRKLKLKSKSSEVQAFQGRGPLWGGGNPDDELVWRSTQYAETTYDLGGRLLTDAKGSLTNGKCWREIGVFSESLGYSDVDCDLVQPLDELLDRTCLVPSATKLLFP